MGKFEWDGDGYEEDGGDYEKANLDDNESKDIEADLPTLTSNFSIVSDAPEGPSKCAIFFTNVFRFLFGAFFILYSINFQNISTIIDLDSKINYQTYLHPAFLFSMGVFYLLTSILSFCCFQGFKKFEIFVLILALIGNVVYQTNKIAYDQTIKFYDKTLAPKVSELLKVTSEDSNTHNDISNGVKLFPSYNSTCGRETSETTEKIFKHLNDNACGVDTIAFLLVLVIFVKCWHFGCCRKGNNDGVEATGSGFSYISNSLMRLFMMDAKNGGKGYSETSVKKKVSKNNKVGDAWAEAKTSEISVKAKKKAELQRVTKRQSDSFMKHVERKQSASKISINK